MPLAILWPTFALVLLIFTVWVMMSAQRAVHYYRNRPDKGDLARGDTALSHPTPLSANFRALFQLPVLYFALVPLLLLTHRAGHLEVALAWIFVALRAVQSLLHIGTKKWGASGAAILFSNIALVIMWIAFFVDMLQAAGAYHQALGGV